MPLSPIAKLVARVLLDLLCLFAAYSFTVWLATRPGEYWSGEMWKHAVYYIVFAGIWCGTTFDQHLYVSRRGESLTAVLFSITKVAFITIIFSGFLLALGLRSAYSRPFFVVFALGALAIMLCVVLISRPGIQALRRRYSECRVLFVGVDERVLALVRAFQSSDHRLYHLVGFLEEAPERGDALARMGVPHLGKACDLEQLLVGRMIDEVYLALPLGEHYEEVERVAHLCETIGVPVRLVGDMFPVKLSVCDFGRIDDIPLLSLMTRPPYLRGIQLRRVTEMATALLLLLALAPLMLAIAIGIKITSPGPVCIRCSQPGDGERAPRLWAFRTHRPGTSEPTGFGRFLRKHGLDELPRLLNVLLGQATYTGTPLCPGEAKDGQRAGKANAWTHLKPRLTPTLTLAGLDACCIALAYVASIRMAAVTPDLTALYMWNYLPFAIVLLLVWYAAAVEWRLWRWRSVEPLAPAAFGLSKAVGNAAVVSGFLLAVAIPGARSTRLFLLTFFCLSFVGLLLLRAGMRLMTRISFRMGYRLRRVVIVGANERSAELIQALGPPQRFGYHVVGMVDDTVAPGPRTALKDTPLLGALDDLDPVLKTYQIHETFVTLPVRSQFEQIKAVVDLCERERMAVHVLGKVLPLSIAKCRTVFVEDRPLISLTSTPETYAWQAIKRLIDFVCATMLILMFAPLFVLIAVLIKLDSKGPVFFVQDRVGKNHRLFKMIKFRSMVSNAEDLKQSLMHLNEAEGPVFKIRQDPRVTPLGHFLRKYSLDELPQLFNVWLGHMSLVGPRPLMPHEVAKFAWFERRRLSVKPGMTGPWQVSGRSDVSFDEWVAMDLAYIDSWTFWADFRILLKTFNAVLSGRGAA